MTWRRSLMPGWRSLMAGWRPLMAGRRSRMPRMTRSGVARWAVLLVAPGSVGRAAHHRWPVRRHAKGRSHVGRRTATVVRSVEGRTEEGLALARIEGRSTRAKRRRPHAGAHTSRSHSSRVEHRRS